ncbi:hypothetical protein [Hymenobacter sp. GOD-10R]|uniref:hypothetical protein n=1 Tax=Hymenobacter sp. GOD-10R TaxID=3093922 RepID=UPI002D76E255|nr:hypothetical protein [Hymenobacter sp. GOD-10R]WRQ28178.1 hypothetical protein SD425_24235 [Hymenobacter sp. GOD-10R]
MGIKIWMGRIGLLLAGGWSLGSCAAVGNVTQLNDDWYEVMHLGGNDTLAARLHDQRVYVQQRSDSLVFTPYSTQPVPAPIRYQLQPDHHVLVLDRNLDLDVFTIPVKVRPARAGVPVQLNSNFNAALYLGRRLNFYYLSRQNITPWQQAPRIRATGLGYGGFLGLGSTLITGDVTQQQAGPEYEGLVLHAGLATLYDARIFNVGLAAGLDHLIGPDRRSWIYQHRPWLGLLFSLDLN